MIILPAIDLYEGRVVRLLRGDYAQMTVYDTDPARTAEAFVRSGAAYLHVVDLKAAKSGEEPDYGSLEKICRAAGVPVEFGGGVRSLAVYERCLEAGAQRVILGTAAVEDESFLGEAARRFPDSCAVGVDVKEGRVATRGWTERSAYTLEAFTKKMQSAGIGTLVCTDVSKDGALRGSNLSMYKTLQAIYAGRIVASGGVSALADVRELAKLGLYGAVIGKALYTGDIDLGQAVREAK